MTHSKRLSTLEAANAPPPPTRPGYRAISPEDWAKYQAGELSEADLGITGPTKIFIGWTPGDWNGENA